MKDARGQELLKGAHVKVSVPHKDGAGTVVGEVTHVGASRATVRVYQDGQYHGQVWQRTSRNIWIA